MRNRVRLSEAVLSVRLCAQMRLCECAQIWNHTEQMNVPEREWYDSEFVR